MSSRRLPGKMLAPIAGRPLLAWLIERLSACTTLDGIILATSDHPSDAPLAELAEKLGIPCYRGPLDDVAMRFIQTIDVFGLPSFVRICGDSPLIDPALVDYAVRLFEAGPCDITTNVHPRSFPKGQSVEVVNSAAFKAAYAAMTENEEREHVTSWFYNHTAEAAITNFTARRDMSSIRLCVDTAEDLASIRALAARMTSDQSRYSLNDLLALHAETEKPGAW